MIRQQVIDSVPYALETCPKFETPEELFNWLKFNTTYKNDPPGYEFVQSMQTLMTPYTHSTGIHYAPGEGDCDCFVVTALACMYVQGVKWHNFGIILSGRQKRAPVHIYTYIVFNNKFYIFDLTNKYFGEERKYPYKQELKL